VVPLLAGERGGIAYRKDFLLFYHCPAFTDIFVVLSTPVELLSENDNAELQRGCLSGHMTPISILIITATSSPYRAVLASMDPSYTSSGDEGEDAAAMAKAMGFSSFGQQGPSKKRKFNPATDAVIEGQALASLDKGGKRGQGSGGNQIPLGKTRVFGTVTTASSAPGGNTDEILLDDEEDDDDDKDSEGIENLDMSLPALGGDGDDEEGDYQEPSYIDTSLPPPIEQVQAAQERIDTILARNSTPATLPPKPNYARQQGSGRGVAPFMTQFLEMPPPLPAPGIAKPAMTSQRPRIKGQRNVLWYVDYYDPSFNENPWASLEKEKGLQSRGTWLGGKR
jgi:hypothetical protein